MDMDAYIHGYPVRPIHVKSVDMDMDEKFHIHARQA